MYSEKAENSSNRRDVLFNYLINDDIQISANSSYTSLNDFFDMGQIGDLVDKGVKAIGGITGSLNESHASMRNIFNFSLWEKTEPMAVSLKIVLYSKTDPFVDVILPAYIIAGHSGLDKIPDSGGNHTYAVPGVSFLAGMALYNQHKKDYNIRTPPETVSASNLNAKRETSISDFVVKNKKAEGNAQKQTIVKGQGIGSGIDSPITNSKIFSFLIDGLISLDKAMVKSLNITYSKHTAKSSEKMATYDYPIWAEIDLQIESILPATSHMLWDSLSYDGKSSILTKGIKV
jgi:hypothetical protein